MSRRNRVKVAWALLVTLAVMAMVPITQRVHGYLTPTPLERFRSVEVPSATGPNILLIVADTLRADHVSLYGYHRETTPNIDAFFSQGTVYERAYAPVSSTGPSMVSVLSGLYPYRHRVRVLVQKITPDVVTFVDHLRRAGYETAAIISNAMLADSACGLGDRFDHYDDFVDEQEPFRENMYERSAARTTDAAIQWLVTKWDRERPHFLWVHYMDPHGPYRPPEDKPVDFSHEVVAPIVPERVPTYSREPNVYDGNDYVDRYDEEIAYTDREIGRLLSAYADLGLRDDAVIVFTSDHGESMMEHEYWFRHEMTVYDEMVRVPLAIRFPGKGATRESVPVSTIDLMPTILELASLPVPEGLDAVTLLPKPKPRDIFCEGWATGGGQWRGLINGHRKTMVRSGMSNIVRESRAYDLQSDPEELRPVPIAEGDRAVQLLTKLVESDPDPGGRPRMYDKGNMPNCRVAPTNDPKMLERLRALGYLGD